MDIVSMKCGATISDDGEVTVYLDPLVVVGDAENEDVAAKALRASSSGSAAQLNDRIDGNAGAVDVLSIRVIDVPLSAFCFAHEKWEVHGLRELGGIINTREVFQFDTLIFSKGCR